MITTLLNKTIKIPVMVLVVRAIFWENNKYYQQVSLDEYPYEIQKWYIMIELTIPKESVLIKQVHWTNAIFATIGIS